MDNPTLSQVCTQFRRRVRGLTRRLAAYRLTTATLLVLAAAIAADWLVRFGVPGRWMLLAGLLLAVGGAAVWLWRPARRKWTDLEVLTYLDSIDPQSRDSLVNLYEMAHPERIGETVTPEGRQLLAHAVAQLAPAAQRVQLDRALRRDSVRRWGRIVALLAVLALAMGAIYPQKTGVALRRVFLPWSAVKWPTRTTVEVVAPASGWRVAQGEDLRFAARVTGQRPPHLEVWYKSRSTDFWIPERAALDEAGLAHHVFPAVDEPIEFYVIAGDDRTDPFTVAVTERPRIKKIVAYYAYPRYAGLANRQIESGQLRGLEGTQVTINFETSVPIQSAVFALEGKAEEPLSLTSPTTFSKTLLLEADGQYAIKLTDPQGFREYKPERYSIQVTPDNPPEVRLLAPGKDIVATPQASLRFAVEARDDFGLLKVAFLSAVSPGGKPAPLSDQITGPIPQTGKLSKAEFTWDFSKQELTHNVDVEYWAVATDCNPTGRGVTESPHFKVSLLTPTDFHNQVLYEAKKVLAEARIAYRNQKKSYWAGQDWAAAGAKATDEQWDQIVELQEAAGRAGEAIRRWTEELKEHIERNRMQDAFMENRLGRIEDLRRGAEEQMTAARQLLVDAHPKNSAEAQPQRLQATRVATLQKAADRQKLATVGLGRLLRQMYDWENLQSALVNSALLRERQAEIYDLTRQTAPQTIGREAQDLDEKTVDAILNIAQRQKAAMENEANLENQLASIALKADAEARVATKRYLLVAYGYLRDIRVNNTLKIVAGKIADNQLADVADDQMRVVAALKVVEAGLLAAGKNSGDEETVAVADLLKREREDVEVARIETPTNPDATDDPVQVNEAAIKKLLDETVPVGEDALSQTLANLAEDQDNVRSRTAYLAQTLTPQDMPRYQRLKMGMLRYRQKQTADYAQQKLEPLLEKSEYRGRMEPWYAGFSGEIQGLQTLLEAGNLSQATRRIQDDVIEASRDLAQFLARQKRLRDRAAEHVKKGGVDDFNRDYVLRGDDLTRALGIYEEVDWNRTVQGGLARQSEWLKAEKDKAQAPTEIRQQVQNHAAAGQETVAQRLTAAKAGALAFSDQVKDKVEQTGVNAMPDQSLAQVAAKIRQFQVDQAARAQQDQAQETMRQVLNRFKQLVDEPVAVAAPAATQPSEVALSGVPGGGPAATQPQPAFYTEEELARLTTPEAIKAGLEASTLLPPEIKERMLRNLPKEFPEKYRRLVGAYYRDLLENKPDEPQGANP